MTSSTDNKKFANVAVSTNNIWESTTTTCPFFNELGALQYMLFSIQWRKFMQFKSVEEQIIHGTRDGIPINELRVRFPDKISMLCRIFNAGLETNLTARVRTIHEELLTEFPWMIYWLSNTPIALPIGEFNGVFTIDRMPTNRELAMVRRSIPGFTDRALNGLWASAPNRPVQLALPAPANIVLVGNFHRRSVLERMSDAYLRANRLTSAAINTALTAIMPLGEDPDQAAFDQYMSDTLNFTQIAEFVRQTSSARGQFNKSEEYEVSENTRCATVFSKLGPNATNMAITEIARRDWHAAYQIINARYLEKGIGDIAVFETEARSIKMRPGQPLQDHIAHLQESLKQWATVKFLSAECIRLHGNMQLIRINIEESTANSGNLTDQQILDLGFTVRISEETRYDIYEKSVDSIKRFSSIIDIFSTKERHDKTVRALLTMLENMEKSAKGQLSFREEFEALSPTLPGNPDKKRTALVAQGKAKGKGQPGQTCKFHPGRKVSHAEKDCFLNPVNGKSSAVVVQADGFKPPCSWCAKRNPKLAARHNDSNCWFNPSSDAYDPAKAPSAKSKTPALSAEMVDRLLKLETSTKSMLSKLSKSSKSGSSSKKRKHATSDDDVSQDSEA